MLRFQRSACLAMLLASCSAGVPAPAAADDAGTQRPGAAPREPVVAEPATPSPASRTARSLVVDARWPVLAVPIGVDRDGKRWLGAIDHDLVLFDDGRESARYRLLGAGIHRIASLPDGGWVAGARILASDGRVRFDGYGWGRRFGRQASVDAIAVSPNGRVAIAAGADSPSRCRGDDECGDPGSDAGALVRLDLTDVGPTSPPRERMLVEHQDRREFVVAASNTRVVAIDGRTLHVWPATDDGPARTFPFADTPRTLDFVGERFLVGTRWIDPERGELVVYDADADFAVIATAPIEGAIQAIAVHPTRPEVALATVWYRARERVEIDEKRVEVYGVDGKRLARVDVPDVPRSLAWSPAGDALLVAISSNTPSLREVIRYRVE